MSTLAKRFWMKVDTNGPVPEHRTELGQCWLWLGARTGNHGYGSVGIERGKTTTTAHRIAWQLEHGTDPGAMHVLHKCDNKLCVRPAHLFIGTQAENIADMMAKGRYVSAPKPRGSAQWQAKLTEDDVLDIRSVHAFGGSCADIASAYGMTPQNVRAVVSRKTWRHVA
jgi:HNH endonuclease